MTEISPDDSALRDRLADLLRAERLDPQRRGDWLLIDEAFPALRAHLDQGALWVELTLYDGRVIRERFAAQDGLMAFSDGPLRVFLSAFWERHNPGLVAREVWKRADGPWLAITGPYLRQVSSGEAAPVPYRLFGMVQDFVREAALDDDLHWLSMQVSVVEGQAHVFVQLDNVEQPELADALRALDWPRDDRIHAMRNFMLLARS